MKTTRTFRMSIALCVALALSLSPGMTVWAWEQPAHEIINREAVEQFQRLAENSEKYRGSAVDLIQTVCRGPVVTTSSRTSYYFDQMWLDSFAAEHIVWGGSGADEPHLDMSVKHFYDPFALDGSHELTDKEHLHGLAYEAVPATDWALTREDNPYSLIHAMRYYRQSLEIASDAPVQAISDSNGYRDMGGMPEDVVQMRSMYLGKAMRGLGEVLHLVGDMTQPAHVRNDAHPRWEITEQAVTESVASQAAGRERIDDLRIGTLGDTVFDVMDGLAVWTNTRFFSEDTMFDPEREVMPSNWLHPYPSPTFAHFEEKVIDGYPTWVQHFSGHEIPMLRQEPGWVYGHSYIIPKEFAEKQAQVLLPLAVAGAARTIDLFMPTLKLSQSLHEVSPSDELQKAAQEQGILSVKQFEVQADVQHEIENDPQWQAFGMQIAYSGPGELWRQRRGRAEKISDLEFQGGRVVAHQDPETGEMTQGLPHLLLPQGITGQSDLSGPAIDYAVTSEDLIFVRVDAGIRSLVSDPHAFEAREATLSLSADATSVMPGENITFSAQIDNPPDRHEIEWRFGDEDPDALETHAPTRNRHSQMTHAYETEGEFTVTARLLDRQSGLALAEDSLTVQAEFEDLSGPWDIVLTVEEESSVLRHLVIGISKALVRFFFSPLAQALTGEPIDESLLDDFTFIGTTITYQTHLRRADDDDHDIAFTGDLHFIESNTGYISAPADIVSVSLIVEDGHLVFYASGYDDQGRPVHFPYLTQGSMISPREMSGVFDLPGALSGTWEARR